MNDINRQVITDQEPSREGVSPISDLDAEVAAATKALTQPASTAQQPAPAATPPATASKFDGKSKQEVEAAYVGLEATLGHQAQELGHLRDLSERLLLMEEKRTSDLTNSGGSPQHAKLTEDMLLDNPHDAVASVAEATVAPTNNRLDAIEAKLDLQAFEGRHPTFQKDMNDPAFQKWVSESPYRQRLAAQIREGERTTGVPDFLAADELWSAYGETQAAATAGAEQQHAVTQEQVTQAQLAESGGEEQVALKTSDKIWSSLDLQRLKVEDRDKYYDPAFQKVIMQAFREKRVK